MDGVKNLSADEKRAKMRRPNYDELRDLKDPCVKENNLTMKCLDEHGYDGNKCADYFMNYRSCRKFWARVEADRKKKGIQPYIPLPNERDAIKKEYEYMITGKPR